MIHAVSIVKNYGGQKVLRDISFDVNEGELVGFIGPDGAGKTTLFRILTTLILPDSGTVTMDGLDVVLDYKRMRNTIGYMPGQFSLYSDLSVEENLNFFATVFGTTIKDNYDLIWDIYKQIEPFKERLAGRLSGGMKQKLALSCALIHQPKVLVLDEPTTGVDAVSRVEFWDLLMGLKAKGITILVSTPYMDEAVRCDRVALIQKGILLATDTPRNIIDGFVKRIFSVRTNNHYKLLKDLRQLSYIESVYPFGQELHVIFENSEEGLPKAEELLRSGNYGNYKIQPIEPGIEDVFMDLMKEQSVTPD